MADRNFNPQQIFKYLNSLSDNVNQKKEWLIRPVEPEDAAAVLHLVNNCVGEQTVLTQRAVLFSPILLTPLVVLFVFGLYFVNDAPVYFGCCFLGQLALVSLGYVSIKQIMLSKLPPNSHPCAL